MADDAIQVTIGADASGLVAGAGTAKAEINKIVEALAILQKSVHATSQIMTTEMVGAINGLKGNLASLEPQAQRAAASIEEVHKAASGGGAHGSGRLLFEVHALFDELSSGRDHQAIGTFSNLTYILYGMNPAFAAAAVGALAFGGGLYYLIESATKTENELKRLAATAEQGLFSTSRQSALDMVTTFAQLSNQSQATAADILAQYDKLGKGGRELATALIPVAEALALANNIPLEKEFEKLLPLFAETADATKQLKAEFPGLNDALLQQVNRFRALGDNGSAARLILDALKASTKETASAIIDAQAKSAAFADTMVTMMAAGDDLSGASTIMAANIKSVGERADEAKLKFEGFARAAHDMINQSPISLQRQDEVAKSAGDKAAPQFKELDEAQTGLAAITTRLFELKLQLLGTNNEIARLGNLPSATNADVAALQAATTKRSELNAEIRKTTIESQAAANKVAELGQKVGDGVLARDAITQLRAQLKEIENTVPESAERTKREIDAIMASPASKGGPSPQSTQAAELLAEKQKELQAQGVADYRRSEQEKVVAANDSAKARAAAAASEAEYIRTHVGETSNAYRDAALQAQEAARTAANERIRIAASDIDEEIKARERVTNAALKAETDDVRNHRSTAQEGAAAAVAALQQEEADLQAMFARKAALYANDEKAQERVENERKDKIAAINEQIVLQQQQAADATAKAWQSGAQDVESAWNSNLRGLLSGTENFGTALRKTVADLVLQLIEGFERFAVNAVLQYTVVQHAATASSAIQVAANETAASGGMGALIGNAVKAVTIDAGQTFAGVAAFLAPILGPAALGPAAAAQATVMGAVASADIGMYNVPQDQLALIHRNEMVMPAAQASALREMLSSTSARGNSGAGQGGPSVNLSPQTHFHVNAVDGAGVAQFFKSNQREMMRAVNNAVRDGAHLGLRRIAT